MTSLEDSLCGVRLALPSYLRACAPGAEYPRGTDRDRWCLRCTEPSGTQGARDSSSSPNYGSTVGSGPPRHDVAGSGRRAQDGRDAWRPVNRWVTRYRVAVSVVLRGGRHRAGWALCRVSFVLCSSTMERARQLGQQRAAGGRVGQ